MLSEEDRQNLNGSRAEILKRLSEFAETPPEKWQREVALCLLTPQSSPVRAEQCLKLLEREGLFVSPVGISTIAETLRRPECYIRFHNNKARYLFEFVENWREIEEVLNKGSSPAEEREFIVQRVRGLGPKEASHALRNIGRRNLAILDRHILRELINYGVIDEIPKSLSVNRYRAIELSFLSFAHTCQEDMDVLDLFFWSKATGFVFK